MCISRIELKDATGTVALLEAVKKYKHISDRIESFAQLEELARSGWRVHISDRIERAYSGRRRRAPRSYPAYLG